MVSWVHTLNRPVLYIYANNNCSYLKKFVSSDVYKKKNVVMVTSQYYVNYSGFSQENLDINAYYSSLMPNFEH